MSRIGQQTKLPMEKDNGIPILNKILRRTSPSCPSTEIINKPHRLILINPQNGGSYFQRYSTTATRNQHNRFSSRFLKCDEFVRAGFYVLEAFGEGMCYEVRVFFDRGKRKGAIAVGIGGMRETVSDWGGCHFWMEGRTSSRFRGFPFWRPAAAA
jgi:hypothetical protein